MSLDLYIGEGEQQENFNYTYNVSNMWYKIFPQDEGMVQIENMPGQAALYKLHQAFNVLMMYPREFESIQPENQWGSYKGLVHYIVDLMLASRRHPDKIWRASR